MHSLSWGWHTVGSPGDTLPRKRGGRVPGRGRWLWAGKWGQLYTQGSVFPQHRVCAPPRAAALSLLPELVAVRGPWWQ